MPQSVDNIIANPTYAGCLTADAGGYVSVTIPGQYGNPDRTIRVINASHRIIVTVDDGSEFLACLDPAQTPVPTEQIQLI